jgi:hypothetical protein
MDGIDLRCYEVKKRLVYAMKYTRKSGEAAVDE